MRQTAPRDLPQPAGTPRPAPARASLSLRAEGGQAGSPVIALIVAAAFFMENLDGTVIATALPQMARSFSVDAVTLGVGVSAYLLALAVFIPISGWVADRFGTRTVFAAAMAVFTGASLLCGLSTGVWGFVAARLLQGAGGAMMVPVGRLVVLRTTPKAELMRAFSLLTWPALVAPMLGPPVGGVITTYASWRWIFFLNLPLGLAGLLLIARFVPQLRAERRRPFDAPGFVLGAVSLGAVMEGLDLLGRAGQGTGPALLVVVGGLAVGLLAVWHAGRAAHPMLELGAFAVPTFRITTAAGSVFRLTINTAPFLLPLLFQLGFGLSAFASGLLVLATFAGNFLMKPFTTPLLRRFGFRSVLVVNGVVSALATLACCALVPATPHVLVAAVLFAGGLSRSMQFTALNTLAFADVPPERMSGASSLASMIQQVAAGLAVAFSEAGLRLSGLLTGHAAGRPGVAEFHLCFALVALVTLLGVPGVARLARDAGAEVSRGR